MTTQVEERAPRRKSRVRKEQKFDITALKAIAAAISPPPLPHFIEIELDDGAKCLHYVPAIVRAGHRDVNYFLDVLVQTNRLERKQPGCFYAPYGMDGPGRADGPFCNGSDLLADLHLFGLPRTIAANLHDDGGRA